MKVLEYDLETAPGLAFWWGDRLYETDILEVVIDPYILGFSYKWSHLDTVHWVGMRDFDDWQRDYVDLPNIGRIYTNNAGVVKKLWELIDQADYYIAHNGKNFDNRFANFEFMKHKLGPPSRPVAHDTKQLWKSNFRGPSNKLDEIARSVGLGRKEAHTGKKLWLDCMNGDQKAWKNMASYAKQDVRLLHAVWELIKPWMKNPPNWNLEMERPRCCPACGSSAFMRAGNDATMSSVRQKYRCSRKTCRHIWRGEVIKRITTTHWVDPYKV